jgi:DNA helicase II / ATP-dependent DNA helicase PcrA
MAAASVLGEDPAGALALRSELAARGLVDFDGLVGMPAALLRDHPDIAAGLRARWPRVSVDEYQDIDGVQYDLLRMICGDGAGLTAIGDPDQAIYGFRGADVGIFGAFAADFPVATTVELTRNYRSSPPIVAAAVQAIAPTTLVPGRKAIAARDGLPDPDDTDGVVFHEAADEHAEAAWIAAAVDNLLGGTSFHSLDSGRADGHGHVKLGLSDIAVLYRTDAQAGPLGQALIRAGLPYQKRSHDLLARRAWVSEILREMRLDTGADAGPDVASRLTAAVRALAATRGGRDATAIDIRAAGELLTPLARRCGTDVERFQSEISLGAETDALDPRAEAITLLTLHGAKGLEFDVVFLAGCERGLLPLRLPGSGPLAAAEEAEERRLLFVGMTRARGKLLLSCAARRSRHGSEEPAGRSPFLAAVDPGLLGPASAPRARRTADRQLRLL